MTSTARRPLEGITVLDLSWHLAGPYCTMALADLGARVIKIERPGANGGYDPGGVARFEFQGDDVHYIALNRNKESIILDLKSEEGREVFFHMVAQADVVFNNFRPGTMQKLGLDFETVKTANDKIIYASLSAFGATGPDTTRPGVDLVIQAESAGMSMTGYKDGPPARAGLPIADLAGGMWSAMAILAAIRERDAFGTGAREIDMSLFDSHLSMIPYFSAYLTTNGFVPGPQGSGGHSPTYGAFETADGSWLVLAVIDQKPWNLLCEALEAPQLLEDPRFASAGTRIEHTEDLRKAVQEILLTKPRAEWMTKFRGLGVPSGSVNDLREALDHPQVAARDMLVDVPYVGGGTVKLLGNPVNMSGFEKTFASPPRIGQDTDRIIAEFTTGAKENAQ
ncbi:CaiB/BaiF CoA transferase family protein [Rhodococcus artemisiae]|uniref:CoA transferase n=1 Tax=Rhodococcus artemisiae TaxID=714159 RepID=A0ABU7LCH1_9NOCA|nr:CoA transferase [Rhodococcus artemisiae]MEE2059009.1 CoA transferase [Rhodococcus artemisiae]